MLDEGKGGGELLDYSVEADSKSLFNSLCGRKNAVCCLRQEFSCGITSLHMESFRHKVNTCLFTTYLIERLFQRLSLCKVGPTACSSLTWKANSEKMLMIENIWKRNWIKMLPGIMQQSLHSVRGRRQDRWRHDLWRKLIYPFWRVNWQKFQNKF